MSIGEEREEQPHWIVTREEVELTEEVLGRGGWGEVTGCKFSWAASGRKIPLQCDSLWTGGEELSQSSTVHS